MALDVMHLAEIIDALEGFLTKRRPPKEVRNQLDIMYQIDGQSIIIFEVRPHWMNKKEIIESPLAKTTWIESKKNGNCFGCAPS